MIMGLSKQYKNMSCVNFVEWVLASWLHDKIDTGASYFSAKHEENLLCNLFTTRLI